MEVGKEINDFLHKCGIRRDSDVCHLSLTAKGCTVDAPTTPIIWIYADREWISISSEGLQVTPKLFGKLTSVPDLSRFHFLRKLWLNNNKIRELSCRSLNCCLTELHLHNNNIKSITGALNHLTCLRLLFLHNNRIRGLEDTMHELRRMQQLHSATFFLNPISHEPGYRHHVIHCLPSVQLLDRREVKPEERRTSFQMFRQDSHRVLQTVAFGRRVH